VQIESLKDLEKLIKLMRKTGVDRIEIDGIKLELGTLPETGKYSPKTGEKAPIGVIDESTQLPYVIQTPDALTDEQLLMWSATGGQELGPGETL